MAKHDCQVPGGASPRVWRCPVCRREWRWDPNAGAGADLWHGNDNVRLADGSKPTTTFWSWLCS